MLVIIADGDSTFGRETSEREIERAELGARFVLSIIERDPEHDCRYGVVGCGGWGLRLLRIHVFLLSIARVARRAT